MKKFFKILFYFILTIIGFIIILTVIAKLTENKIAEIALNKISKEIKAPVKINDVSFNLIRKFPLATIELNDVSLGSLVDSTKLDSTNLDTILRVKNIYVSVKTAALIKGNIEIIKVQLKDGVINYLVDTSGVTNIDFLLTEDTTELDTTPSEPLNLALTELSLENISCNYNDSALKAIANILIPNLKLKANLEGDNILASTRGLISLTECAFEETNLCLMNKTVVDFDLDYENDSVYFNKLNIDTDGANLDLLGSVVLGDIIKTNINFKANDLTLEELIKYAPDTILNEFGIKKIAGLLNIEAKVEGIYSETEMPKVDAKIDLQNGNIVTKDYPELKNISLNSNLTNGILKNNQSTQVNVPVLQFETAKSKFNFDFSVLDIDQPKYSLKTNLDINIGEFKDFIPDSLLEEIDGNILANISTSGELPDSIGDDFIDKVMQNTRISLQVKGLNAIKDPTLSVKDLSVKISYKPNNFQVRDLNLTIPDYNVDLTNTSLNADFWGSINNMSALKVNLKSYHLETKGSTVTGYAKIKNLDDPDYEFESNILTNLEEAKVMLPDSLVKTLKGNVEINVQSKAKLKMDSLEFQVMDIVFRNSSYSMNLSNIYAELYDFPEYTVENFSGQVKMEQDTIEIYKMNGTAAGIDFEIDSTEIWNVYPVIIQEKKSDYLTVQTKININEINNHILAPFLISDTTVATDSNIDTQPTAAEEGTTDSIPGHLLPNLQELGIPHFLVRGSLAIKKVEYEKNIIDDISLLFRFTDSLYVIDQFKLKTCGGELNSSLMFDARNWERPKIDIKNYISKLDVKELLLRNDNFGDTSLTYDKINGFLTSEMHIRVFNINGEWPTDKIRAEGHFTLEKGKIYGYEPLVDLSKNKVIGGLKELDKLKFNTLKTSIFMYKDKIFIPKTNVQTSSMDFTAFAMHGLQGDYEYHVEVHLGDVFSGKSDELMKKQAKHLKEEGETFERSGGLRFYSSKYGDKKKNGFDSPKKEQEFLKDLNKQKGWLRLLFNPLLVNFSTELDRTARNKELIEKSKNK